MSGFSPDSVPSIRESVQRDSAEQWRQRERDRRRFNVFLAVVAVIGAGFLAWGIWIVNGGHWA